MIRKSIAVLVGAFLMLGSVTPMLARNYDNCDKRIRKAEMRLQKAIHKHGASSRQAATRRRQLDLAHEYCGR
jgi:hypothetical protein